MRHLVTVRAAGADGVEGAIPIQPASQACVADDLSVQSRGRRRAACGLRRAEGGRRAAAAPPAPPFELECEALDGRCPHEGAEREVRAAVHAPNPATSSAASSESPPSEKKSSAIPTRSTPSTSPTISDQAQLDRAPGRCVIARAGSCGADTPSRAARPIRWTFPVGPLGISSTNATTRGTLKSASCCAANAWSSCVRHSRRLPLARLPRRHPRRAARPGRQTRSPGRRVDAPATPPRPPPARSSHRLG